MRWGSQQGAAWALLLGAAACASDVATEPPEPLAQQAAASPSLQLALMFHGYGKILPVDGGVVGDFPAHFRLGALPPPPAELMAHELASEVEEPPPRYSMATIGAVARDRDPHAVSSSFAFSWRWACGATRDEGCIGTSFLCDHEFEKCATVRIHCDIEDRNCTILEIAGSLSLIRDSWRQLEGRVTDTYLLYVYEDAPAGSRMSQLFAAGAPLASGYYFAEPREMTEAQSETQLQCETEALAQVMARYVEELGQKFEDWVAVRDHLVDALDQKSADWEAVRDFLVVSRFNARHGTSYPSVQDILEAVFDADARRGELWEVQTTAAQEIVQRRVAEKTARQCYLNTAPFTLLGPASSRELSMTLASPLPKVGDSFPDGPPFGWDSSPLDP